MTTKRKYLFATIILFLVEVIIAVYIHDTIIRPYIGDVLVVILLYCFVKAFVTISTIKAAIGVLFFWFIIEFLQHLNIVNWLGLSHNKLANIIIGNSFSWIDILCNIVGILVVIIFEKFKSL